MPNDQVSSDIGEDEISNVRSQIDVARARFDGALRVKEAIAESNSLDDLTLSKIDSELSAAEKVVRDLEKDAESRGIPTTLSGNRYRIYVT